jgi:hypothetical protein
METDLQLMFSNATAFNEPGSQIYKDARYIKSFFLCLVAPSI